MTKTIIIPTDFSVESLDVLKKALNQNNDQKYNLILLHGVDIGDSISDLLTFSKQKVLRKLSNPEFEEACAVIKNKFESKIESFRVDIFTGYNQAAFDNYLESNQVEEAFIPTEKLVLTSKRSFDILKFIYRSKIFKNQVPTQKEETVIPGSRGFARVFSH